jgi:Flp pilus assembly protein TadG
MRIAPTRACRTRCRQGAAAVELAVVLPLLCLLALGAFDFGRVFVYYIIVTNCARNGALWASDPLAPTQSRYRTVDQAAKADAPTSLQSQLDVSSTPPDANNYIRVTVHYRFSTVVNYPVPNYVLPHTIDLSPTITMRAAPATPN